VEQPRVPGFHDYYWAVAAAYRVRRYPGAVDFFFGDSINRTYASFWNYAAQKGATMHRLRGDHLDLFAADRLPALANALTNALERSQSEARTL
jgi:hypothetical protein